MNMLCRNSHRKWTSRFHGKNSRHIVKAANARGTMQNRHHKTRQNVYENRWDGPNSPAAPTALTTECKTNRLVLDTVAPPPILPLESTQRLHYLRMGVRGFEYHYGV